jgi:hypothetical protein
MTYLSISVPDLISKLDGVFHFEKLNDEGALADRTGWGNDEKEFIWESMFFDLQCIAEAAAMYFRGGHVMQPFVREQSAIFALPWLQQQLVDQAEEEGVCLACATESIGIKDQLQATISHLLEPHRSPDSRELPWTYGSDELLKHERWTLQGLAVEVLLKVDRSVGHLDRDDIFGAAHEFIEAQKLLMELNTRGTMVLQSIALERERNPEAIIASGDILAGGKIEHAQSVHEVLQRMRQGASRGGMRSGEARRTASPIPTSSELRAERERMIAAGISPRDVAGRLGQRYGCTAQHIRNRLKQN